MASQQPPRQTAYVSISEEDAREFLERLAADDDFRADVEQNPQAILRDHGIQVEAENVPKNVKLPPKEEIDAFLAPLRTRAAAQHNWLGFTIVGWVLGAMPLVVAEEDGTG